MKASEAKPLSADELNTLRDLLQRWILLQYPYYGGSSEESDAHTTYYDVKRTASEGIDLGLSDEELADYKQRYGESELK